MEMSNMTGLCTTHENPDLWFEDSNDLFEKRLGSKNPNLRFQKRVDNMLEAMSICTKCPIRTNCLAEGLKEENLDFGIWGGMLPGERILLADSYQGSSFRKYRIRVAKNIRSLVK